jgi:hypothetical protein
MEGDQGWCSGALAFAIDKGKVDGDDIGGARLVLIGDWPSGFLAGNGTGRLYFDPSIPQKKRAALEKVFQGKMGGIWEPVGALMSKWLPSREAAIQVKKEGDVTRVSVAGHGELVAAPLKGPTGEFTRLMHGAATFRDNIILAKGTGSSWHDPDMRSWQSGGHSEQADFDWSA